MYTLQEMAPYDSFLDILAAWVGPSNSRLLWTHWTIGAYGEVCSGAQERRDSSFSSAPSDQDGSQAAICSVLVTPHRAPVPIT